MKASICDLSMSITKSFGVCLLNPNFSSKTKVWYMLVGRESTCWMTMNVSTNRILCVISPEKRLGRNESHVEVRDQSFGRTS